MPLSRWWFQDYNRLYYSSFYLETAGYSGADCQSTKFTATGNTNPVSTIMDIQTPEEKKFNNQISKDIAAHQSLNDPENESENCDGGGSKKAVQSDDQMSYISSEEYDVNNIIGILICDNWY